MPTCSSAKSTDWLGSVAMRCSVEGSSTANSSTPGSWFENPGRLASALSDAASRSAEGSSTDIDVPSR
jgi:hypothetical protein